MSYLDKLNVSNRIITAARPRRKQETAEYRQTKLISNIEEQIELANLALTNQPLFIQRKRGHRVVKARPRIWWATEPDGIVFTQIRYNKVPLDIGGQGTAIEVGNMENLPSIYQTVIKAVEAGELDQAIESAARKSRPTERKIKSLPS